MWRQLTAWGNTAFRQPWPIVPFQPILFLFLWGAFLRLAVNGHVPEDFAQEISTSAYFTWLGMGLTAPPLALLSWRLIVKHTGLQRYRGMWLRLAADVAMFSTVLAYHVTVVLYYPPNESRMFSRYVVAAAMVFLLGLVTRDVWALQLTERLARRIHRGRDG